MRDCPLMKRFIVFGVIAAALTGLSACASTKSDATFAGSEFNETAIGVDALRGRVEN